MINCLVGYVGLKKIVITPTSGLFINDLHGITTNQFETVRELDENDGILESWNTLEDRAIRLLERDIMSNLKKYYQNHSIITSGLTGFVDDNTLVNHGGNVYAGWLFDMSDYSPSLKLEINDIRVHLTADENFNVRIFDANTGEQLFIKAVTGTSGQNIVKILQEYAVYNHNKIFVAYDTVIPIRIFNDPTVPGLISQGSVNTSSTVLAENIDSSEVGMAVGFNVKCSIEEFVCSRLELFTEPLLYKLGIEYLKNSKYSEEFTRFNLLDTEQTNELIEEYTTQYQDLLDSTFLDLKVPDDGICFICNKMISKKTLIP
ncbi:MAG: hypothetical protein V3W20_00245 [Candidatus Neomarinimicrobiota bacterium]